MNKEYAEKVEVLLRLLPIVMDEKVFAVHGGSAINLFVQYICIVLAEENAFTYGFEVR